jgi:hypothetical protein
MICSACSAWLSACVTVVYQPLSAIRQPVGIDIRKLNFDGFALDVRCQPGALLEPDDANRLCRSVSSGFERQGAIVQIDQANSTVMDGNDPAEYDGNPDPVAKASAPQSDAPKIKLMVELSAKRVRHLKNSWYGPLSFYTLTLVPLIEDVTDEQRIVVRDESGFVLADQSFQIRFIEYMGLGYMALNAAANFLFRTDEEKIIDGTADRLMTRDLHRQVSQVVMNAGARQLALKLATNKPAGGN